MCATATSESVALTSVTLTTAQLVQPKSVSFPVQPATGKLHTTANTADTASADARLSVAYRPAMEVTVGEPHGPPYTGMPAASVASTVGAAGNSSAALAGTRAAATLPHTWIEFWPPSVSVAVRLASGA